MILGIQGMVVVVEVSGTVVVVAAVAVGDGMEATVNLQDIRDRTVGVDLSNIDHQTRLRGESVETTTVSGFPSIRHIYLPQPR